MRKILLALACFFVISSVFSIPFDAYASERNHNVITLEDLSVQIDYDLKDVELVRSKKPNETVVDVVDRETGTVLQRFGEKTVPIHFSEFKKATGTPLSSTDGEYFIKYIYKEEDHGPTTVRLEANLYYYTNGSYARQVEEILYTGMRLTTSGYQTLEDIVTDGVSNDGDFPALAVHISGTATIQVETTEETTGEFSMSFLEQAGFSFGGSTGSTHYYRKVVHMSLLYDLYP